MPLMAHKEHGFHQAHGHEIDDLTKAGWELCSDPMEFKRRAWGKPEAVEVAPVEASAEEQAEEQAEHEIKAIRRRGRHRKGQ